MKRLAYEKFKLKWQLGTVHYTVIMCTGGVSLLMGNSLAAYLYKLAAQCARMCQV